MGECMGMLENKVILVTGASAGIGRATALMLAREGAKVVATARRESHGHELITEIKDAGGEAIWVTADMQSEQAIAGVVEKALSTYGRLDGAFNNAGIFRLKPLTEVSGEDFDETMHTNVRSIFLCMKHEIPAMIRSGGGSIVNCSSLAASHGYPAATLYAASKGAIEAMTRVAAIEYASQRIRINAVSPGLVETAMTQEGLQIHIPEVRDHFSSCIPMQRIGQPEEVAGAVSFLLSDRAAYITGQKLAMDGGISVYIKT